MEFLYLESELVFLHWINQIQPFLLFALERDHDAEFSQLLIP